MVSAAIVPIVFSLGSLTLSVLCLLAGSSTSCLPNMALITVCLIIDDLFSSLEVITLYTAQLFRIRYKHPIRLWKEQSNSLYHF